MEMSVKTSNMYEITLWNEKRKTRHKNNVVAESVKQAVEKAETYYKDAIVSGEVIIIECVLTHDDRIIF